jgi:hypothetical protein
MPHRIGGLVALLTSVALAACQAGYQSGGPLASVAEYGLETHAGPDGIVSWGLVLPELDTGEPAIIESVDPVGVEGLTVLVVLASDPRGTAIGSAIGWPAPSAAFVDARGSAVTPPDGPSPRLQLVFVVHLDAAEGRISSVRVRYKQGETLYEATYDWWLVVRPGPPT